MNELNTFIDTTRKFTAQADAIPHIDRVQQVNVGVEMARRASQQQPAPVPVTMPPIVAVAN